MVRVRVRVKVSVTVRGTGRVRRLGTEGLHKRLFAMASSGILTTGARSGVHV